MILTTLQLDKQQNLALGKKLYCQNFRRKRYKKMDQNRILTMKRLQMKKKTKINKSWMGEILSCRKSPFYSVEGGQVEDLDVVIDDDNEDGGRVEKVDVSMVGAREAHPKL